MHTTPVDQEALKARILPQMTLGDGSSSSVTAPPQSTPHHTSNKERAKLRFAVNGNAIVTGGAGALGLCAARALLEHGLSGLMIFDLDPRRIQSALTELTSDFPAASIGARFVDVTNAVALDEAVAETVEVLGSVDMLLCFNGVVLCAHSLDVTAAEWRNVLEVNTTGSFLVAQAVAKVMVKQGTGGSILFTASISGHRVNYPQPQVAYNVSKAALLSMKDCLAAEWARYGIRCNSISPGYMDTILNEGPGLVEARSIWNSRNPMGRMGLPSLEVNTTGSFLVAQAVAKVMVKQGTGGSILFTASISGHRVNYPQPQVAYNVSKAALLSMKDCLAAEWARYGIRCNSISPGYMDTILNEGPGLVEARSIWNSRNPMGRMGLPSELTGAVVLLCSNAGSYINGVDIVVDGGAIVF